jgi:hypothetical protein
MVGFCLLSISPMTVLYVFGPQLGFPRQYFEFVAYATMALSIFIPVTTEHYIRRRIS